MAAVTGIAGAITSWGSGTIHASLAGTGVKGASFELMLDGDNFDTTGFSDAGVGAALKGLTSWKFSFKGYLAVPEHGAGGLVTYSAGYVTNAHEWNMAISRAAFESTAFGAATKAYIPSKYGWKGSWTAYGDGTTAIASISNSSEPATITAKYSEQGATDMTLSGSAFTFGARKSVSPEALNTVSYDFQGTGALTQSTPSAGTPFIPAGAIALTAAETVVLTATTSRTFTGSAFWSEINIRCAVGQLVEITGTGQGTGALTIA